MKRVMFYVQHLLGIGHLARASRIAQAMAARGMQVTLVTGGLPVPGFPGPNTGTGPDIAHVQLPPVAVSDGSFAGLMTPAGVRADEAYMAARSALLLQTFHDLRPDIVMMEAYPFGRRQVRFELLDLIAAIEAAQPRPKLVTSLRDILQRSIRPERIRETADLVNRHFDRVLVHGDPTFAPLEHSFPLAAEIAAKVVYTGLVCGPKPEQTVERFDVLVSAGGGAVGEHVVTVALEAAALSPELPAWCIITGPNLPQVRFDALAATAPRNVTLVRFRQDFGSLLTGARLSVSQAGYNTVGDILMAGCQSLLIPFQQGGETEQADRADRLEALGRATVLREDDLSGPALAQAILRSIAQPLSGSAPKIAVDGAARTADIMMEM